ncbi:GDSL esterase/lipase EXL3-like protein, partial [Tanacetum coccineum]
MLLSFLLLLLLPSHITCNGSKVPAVIVFGDSVVDTGNNNNLQTIFKVNYPPYGQDFSGGQPTGRFSNGKVPSDFIVEELGVKDVLPPYLDPNLQIEDLLTGVNFASGGGGYDHLTSELAVLISLEGQLELFKEYIEKVKSVAGEEVANTILSKGLFVVATGSNDVTNTYFNNPLRRYHFDFDSYASLMVNSASSFLQARSDVVVVFFLQESDTGRRGIIERGFLSSDGRGVKQKKSFSAVNSANEKSGAKEGTSSARNVEQNMDSSMEHGIHVDGQLSELESLPSTVEGTFTNLSNAFGSPNPTSLAAKVRDIESQMLKGKLVFMGDDEKPLKPKSVSESVNSIGVAAVKATDGAKLTGNGDFSCAYLLNGEPILVYSLGKRVAYPVVENYVKNTWSKYGLVRTMMNSKDLLFYKFSSKDGMDAILENGQWLIRNVPLILKKWSLNANLSKEDLANVPVLKNTKVYRQAVRGVHISSKSHLVYKPVQPKNDKKTDSRQPKPKVPSATYVVNTTITSNSFVALGSMGDVEDARDVGHVSNISENEVINLEEHGPKPNRVEVVNKDKQVTVDSGSVPSTSMDLQEDNSKRDVKEYDNEIAQFMASPYKRHGGGPNDSNLHEFDEYDLYDGYDDVNKKKESNNNVPIRPSLDSAYPSLRDVTGTGNDQEEGLTYGSIATDGSLGHTPVVNVVSYSVSNPNEVVNTGPIPSINLVNVVPTSPIKNGCEQYGIASGIKEAPSSHAHNL